MKRIYESFILLGVAILALILLFSLYTALQSETVYQSSLGKISSNERRVDGEILDSKEPFLPIKDENLRHWDVVHYERIKNDGYKEKADFLYAFYPLFPYIWKISHLNVRQVCIMNYLFYIIGLLFLFSVYALKTPLKEKIFLFILLISLPSSVVFLIPYSEATFFIALSIAIWGYLNKRYWIFFLFMSIAAMTRRASFLLLGASIFSAFLVFLKHRNPRQLITDMLQLCLPVIIGTAAISVIQYISGSGSFFTFIKVTDMFSQVFSIPTVIKDWSHKSYPLNMSVIFTFLPFYFLSMLIYFVKSIKGNFNKISTDEHKSDIIDFMAVGYFAAAMAFIIFFQGGSLNSTFRGILCTPFFIIALFSQSYTCMTAVFKNRLLIALSIVTVVIFTTASYTAFPFKFSYISLILFTGFLLAWNNSKKIASGNILTGSIYFLAFLSMIMLCSLFDTFLGNGWIFT